MSLTLQECKDPSAWEAFVADSPQGSAFCESYFLKALDKKFELWFVTEHNTPKLAFPLFYENDGSIASSPLPFSMYQGPMFSKSHSEEPPHSRVSEGLKLLEFLIGELDKKQSRISFCLHHKHEDLRAFQWFHYHEPEKGAFQLKLYYTGLIHREADFDRYLASIRKSRRSERKKGIDLSHEVHSSKNVDALLELYGLTFARQNIPVPDSTMRLAERIASRALEAGKAELSFCTLTNGEHASANLFLKDKHTAYYLIGANHPEHRNSGASAQLLLKNIETAFHDGLSAVDVCGINSPARGDFKTSLNASPTPYFVVDLARK